MALNIIIPMAGMGKRMRPHTLTTPKPLIPIAGVPIVHRLVLDLKKHVEDDIENIGFVVGQFGDAVERELVDIAASIGAKASIFYQEEALGTAHAVFCARELLQGKTIVAFADTLFKADFVVDTEQDGIVWVHKVKDPSAFGVVSLDKAGIINDFIEKPTAFVSDLAIIGVYYFKNGNELRDEIQFIIANNLKDGNEYQLTRVLKALMQKGTKFKTGTVDEWLDCGNKNAAVHTNQRYLEFLNDKDLVADSVRVENSIIIPPVYIGENVSLYNTVLGPHVSVGEGSVIRDSRVTNAIIQKNSQIQHVNMANSMIGNFVKFKGNPLEVNIGDYSELS